MNKNPKIKFSELILEDTTINEYSQVVDIFSNIDFKDNVVGNSKPSKDSINPALLQDVQTAAKNAGVNVDITTAVSGHRSGSRHEVGNAVDIAIINGKAVRPNNRSDADKFVAELIKLGYVKNKEVGNKKSVLTFGFPEHDDHVHVSNTGGSSSSSLSSSINPLSNMFASLFGKGTTDTSKGSDFLSKFLKMILGVKESRVDENFNINVFNGKVIVRGNKIVIPSQANLKILSPDGGIIKNNVQGISPCNNNIILSSKQSGEEYYVQFCNISTPNVNDGKIVSQGELLGTSDSDVNIYIYNSERRKIDLDSLISTKKETSKKSNILSVLPFSKKSNNKKTKTEPNFSTPKKSYSSDKNRHPLVRLMDKVTQPFGPWTSATSGNHPKPFWTSATSGKTPDWARQNEEKLNEEIKRMKKLL